MMLERKEKGNFTKEQELSLKASVENYTTTRDDIVCKRYGVPTQGLSDYINHYKDDK